MKNVPRGSENVPLFRRFSVAGKFEETFPALELFLADFPTRSSRSSQKSFFIARCAKAKALQSFRFSFFRFSN